MEGCRKVATPPAMERVETVLEFVFDIEEYVFGIHRDTELNFSLLGFKLDIHGQRQFFALGFDLAIDSQDECAISLESIRCDHAMFLVRVQAQLEFHIQARRAVHNAQVAVDHLPPHHRIVGDSRI